MFVRTYFVLLLFLTIAFGSFAFLSRIRSRFSSPKTLEEICAKKKVCTFQGVPFFLKEMFVYLRKPENIKEGMFRKEGKKQKLARLEMEMKQTKTINLRKYDTLEIAAGVKRFLRNLKSPLISNRLATIMSNWSVKNLENVKRGTRLIPKSNRAVFDELLDLLHHLLAHKAKHKMDASTLAKVIGVSLIPKVELKQAEGQKREDYMKAVTKEMSKIDLCLTYLIEHYNVDLI